MKAGTTQAQRYPVQGSLMITPPYPAYLSDYANPTMDKLMLNLTCTDMKLVNERVHMKVTILKGNTIMARSAEALINEPMIMMDGGVPLRLTSVELASYFKLENLQGITPNAYTQTLPEGAYTITFEVFDYFTGNKLSDNISQLFWLMLNDPPLLNTPLNKENIQQGNGFNTQIAFQWTPRSTQVSNAEYEFTLVELWDDYGDPYQQFLASPPKYKTTTNQTTIVYGVTEPPLIPGRSYAWRVQAKAKSGMADIGMYRNDGYSNIYTFKYAGQCAAIQSVKGEPKGSDRIYLEWQAPSSPPSPKGGMTNSPSGDGGGGLYKIAYRQYTTSNKGEWVEIETLNNYLNLVNLEANTEYEIKAGNVCENNLVGYSQPIRVRTLVNGTNLNVNCGQEPKIDLSNTNPIQKLSVYDVVMATDFPVTLTKIDGNAAGWSGEGWVKVPYLADTKIKVTYNNIKVNTDYKLIDGYFETTYDATGKNIADVDKLIDDAKSLIIAGNDVGKVKTGKDSTKYTVDFDIPEDCKSCSFTPYEGGAVNYDDSDKKNYGGGTVNFGDGKKLDVDTLPTTVKDKSGDIFKVEKGTDGKSVVTTKIGNTGGTELIAKADKKKIDSDKGTVVFSAHPKQQYAFDAYIDAYKNNSNWEKSYEKIGDYRVPAKAIAPGVSDVVKVTIQLNGALTAGKVQFVNSQGTAYAKKAIDSANGVYELTVVGGPGGDAQEVYALYPQSDKPLNLGKLLVASYKEQNLTVKLVPVNGVTNFDERRISDSLNAIYNPVNVKVSVTREDNFTWDNGGKGLKVGGSNIFNAYSDEMKALNSAYASRVTDKKAIYFFMLDKAADSVVLGDMPRGKQFGYVFTSGNNNIEHTIAHEIGHGVLYLKHTFDYNGIDKGTLPYNLMDYPAGGTLTKYQWDCLHDPAVLAGVLDGNDAGKLTANKYFWTPSGHVVYIKDEKTDIKGITDIGGVLNKQLPNGVLYGFTTSNGVEYNAKIKDNKFYGYENKNKEGDFYPLSGISIDKSKPLSVVSRIYSSNCTIKEYENKISVNDIQSLQLINDFKDGYDLKFDNVYYLKQDALLATLGISDCDESKHQPQPDFSANFFDFANFTLPPGVNAVKTDDIKPALIADAANKLNQLIAKSREEYAYSTEMTNEQLVGIYVDKDVPAGEIISSDKLIKLDHRLVYLSEYSRQRKTPIDIYVVYQKVDELIGDFNGYAKAVYEKSNLKDNKNAVLITIPYFSTNSPTTVNDFSVQYFLPGVYSNGINIDTKKIGIQKGYKGQMTSGLSPNYETITASQAEKFIEDVYKQTYKPCVIYLGMRFVDGTIVPREEESLINAAGYSFVKTIILKNNRYFDEISKLIVPQPYFISNTIREETMPQLTINPNYESELLAYELKKAELIEKANNGSDKDWNDFSNSIEFKEKQLDELTANKYITGYAFKDGFEQWIKDLNVTYGGTANNPPIYEFKQTYDKDKWSTLDPVVYGVIDAASIVASTVGADAIPESIGLMYSLKRGSAINAAIYSSAIILPVIASGELRAGQALAKNIAKDSKIFFRGFVYTLNTEGKLAKVSTTYTRGRLLEFFKLSDNALSSSELDAFAKAFKSGEIKNSQIKEILNGTDEIARAEKLRSLVGVKGEGAAKLISKIDNLELTALKREINLLEEATKTKFLDEFAGASDDALKAMNDNPSLLNHWKESGDFIKNRTYPNVGHKAWDETKTAIVSGGNSVDNKILNAVEQHYNLKPLTNNQPVMAGAYCEELGGDVIVKYNLSTSEKATFNYKNFDPVIKDHIDYLNFIRQDALKGGKLYEKLYSGVNLDKLIAAGEAGSHAEILAIDEIIKAMRNKGVFSSSKDLSKIKILVKGKGEWGNMCRCPHCYQLSNGVKMVGNF